MTWEEKRIALLNHAPHCTTRLELARSVGIDPKTLRECAARFEIGDDINRLLGTKMDPASEYDVVVDDINEHPHEQYLKRENVGATETLEAKGYRIKTLDDLLAGGDVDLDTWYVERHQINKWETYSDEHGVQELVQVKAWLKRNVEATNARSLRDEIIAEMKAHAPGPVRRYKVKPRSDLAMDILIPDLHLGKLAHAEETGANYDGKIAVRAYQHVFYQLLTHAQDQRVGRIIIPIGHDLLHVDSAENETTRGTRQDVDSRSYRSRKRARALMVESIDAALQIAPVDAVIIPGNHAHEAEAALGDIIDAWYHNEPRLTVHDSPAPRKYLQHGNNLFGYTHGDGKASDLPLLMAVEEPEMWAQSEHRKWLTGHKHSRQQDHFGSLAEYKGVEVVISPSLAAADAWHTERGYVGNLRAAEAHIYSAEDGEIARFRATLPKNF